jgi:hypothetical protein
MVLVFRQLTYIKVSMSVPYRRATEARVLPSWTTWMAQSSGGIQGGGVAGASLASSSAGKLPGAVVPTTDPSDGVVATAAGVPVGAEVSTASELDAAAVGLECWRTAVEEDWVRPMAQARGPCPGGSNHKSAMRADSATTRMMITQTSSRVSQSRRVLPLSSGLVFLSFIPSTESYAVNSQIIA